LTTVPVHMSCAARQMIAASVCGIIQGVVKCMLYRV